MATTRRRQHQQHRTRITPEAIAAFQACDRITLDRALGLKPWEVSPLDAVGECPYPPETAGAQSWPQAVALRKDLANGNR